MPAATQRVSTRLARMTAFLILAVSVQQLAWLLTLGRAPAHPLQIIIFLGFDLFFSIIISCMLLFVQRPNYCRIILAALFSLILLSLSWIKLVMLGEQAFIADIFLLPNLLRALSAYTSYTILLVVFVFFAIFILNLHFLRFVVTVVILAACGAIVFIVEEEVTPYLSETVGDLRARVSIFPTRGHFLAAITVFLEEVEERRFDRDLPTGMISMQRVDIGPEVQLQPRDVHMIVLESFADPAMLPRFNLQPDPFSGMFVTWRDAAPGHLLAPVFGSRSSNTEFEVLCGLPAFAGRSRVVTMQLDPTATPPCLPRLLAERGFQTASLVPSSPEIFRAGHAFSAIGFETRWFETDVATDDRDGIWISAEATLAASRRLRAGLRGSDPALVYTFVNAGHYPFDRDRGRRPDRIVVSPPHATVEAWVNAVHYTALAVAAHIEKIMQRDPEALIIVLGDHQPILGQAFSGHRQGGMIASDDETDPLMHAGLYVTPLIVLNSGRMVATGALPAWHLPYLVLDLLSLGANCGGDACPHRQSTRVRPVAERAFAVDASGVVQANCPVRSTETICAPLLATTARLRASLVKLLRAPGP